MISFGVRLLQYPERRECGKRECGKRMGGNRKKNNKKDMFQCNGNKLKKLVYTFIDNYSAKMFDILFYLLLQEDKEKAVMTSRREKAKADAEYMKEVCSLIK